MPNDKGREALARQFEGKARGGGSTGQCRNRAPAID
jgi:hypothetical protein